MSSTTRLRVVQLLLLTVCIIHNIAAYPFCDSLRYGRPNGNDCMTALGKFPKDNAMHYFVEQQMRTKPPDSNWIAFKDPRHDFEQETIEQLPRIIAYGKCNIAIYSFTSRSTKNTAPPVSWLNVQQGGQVIQQGCLVSGKGGAAVIPDKNRRPGLGLFMWEDGALFQSVINQEMSEQFPEGIDPTLTSEPIQSVQSLLSPMNATFNASAGNDGNSIADVSLEKPGSAAGGSLLAESR